MVPELEDLMNRIPEDHEGRSKLIQLAKHAALWNSGFNCFVEVGMFKGQTTKMLCDLAYQMDDKYRVLTADPWDISGFTCGTDYLNRRDYGYGDDARMTARSKLERCRNWRHFEMPSLDALPIMHKYSWWVGADNDYQRFNPAFVYLDGEHNCRTVMMEFLMCLRYCNSGCIIAIDDMNLMPDLFPMLEKVVTGKVVRAWIDKRTEGRYWRAFYQITEDDADFQERT